VTEYSPAASVFATGMLAVELALPAVNGSDPEATVEFVEFTMV
jgi:hypothetical protein